MQIERLSPSVPADTYRLREIRLRSLLDAPNAFASTYKESLARSEAEWQQGLIDLATFVAVIDGRDVGIARGAPDDQVARTNWLISMWVAPEARGLGAGDALITAVIDWAKVERASQILLDVGDSNTHAIALYERMGFARNGMTSQLDAPRSHITEHQRVLMLE